MKRQRRYCQSILLRLLNRNPKLFYSFPANGMSLLHAARTETVPIRTTVSTPTWRPTVPPTTSVAGACSLATPSVHQVSPLPKLAHSITARFEMIIWDYFNIQYYTSFWKARNEINQNYFKTDGYWLDMTEIIAVALKTPPFKGGV